MKQLVLLPLLGALALVLNSCSCGGCGGSGKVSLKDNCTGHVGGGQVTTQGSTGIPHIGLVPTMKNLAE